MRIKTGIIYFMKSPETPSEDRSLSDVANEAYKHGAVKGEGFVLKDYKYSDGSGNLAKLEFRPGETTETAHKREGVQREKHNKEWDEKAPFRAKESIEYTLSHFGGNSFSKIISIDNDGYFDFSDVKPGSLYLGMRPIEAYKSAKEIQDAYPQYQFDFETDPEGKWFKYTVTKT